MTFFRHITFDLDDTLLDTSGALVPTAARRAIAAMTTAMKIPHETETWVRRRLEILRADPRADVWLRLADGDEDIADLGRRAFFTHPIEALPDEALRLTPGAKDILEWAHEHATLHLVTSGDAVTQAKKVARLGISRYFDSIQYVDAKHAMPTKLAGAQGSHSHAKYLAFQKTQARFPDVHAEQFVSIGNRVDTDLGEAKMLNWKTVWVRYGEHVNLTPQNPYEIPDYEVASLSDLLIIWRQQFLALGPKETAWKG